MLLSYLNRTLVEAGCDESGRGCLAGAVFAAAVIFSSNFICETINDSKQLSEKQRNNLRLLIEREALSWAVGVASPQEIDQMNILNASFVAMHRALEQLTVLPEHLLIDGDRFRSYKNIPYTTIVKGDEKYLSIAASSILAKTHRDEYMLNLHKKFPQYDWDKNKGYPTQEHRRNIMTFGITPYHRKSFTLLPK